MNALRTVLVMCAMGFALAAQAQSDPPADLVKPQLLADVSAIQPGKPFTLGVMMKVKPGWHIYWKNPGDSGAPTKITLTLPDGFKSESTQYPVPVEFIQPGDLIGYGYMDEAMFILPITAPQNLKTGDSIELSATASWLCCESVCIPGHQKLTITLPVASDSSPANQELFQKWTAMVPKQKSDAVASIKPQLSSRADGTLESASIEVNWNAPPKDVHFFPIIPRGVKVEDVNVKNDGKTTMITFSSRPYQGAKPATQPIESVIGFTDEAGNRRGATQTIPVRVPKQTTDSNPNENKHST